MKAFFSEQELLTYETVCQSL